MTDTTRHGVDVHAEQVAQAAAAVAAAQPAAGQQQQAAGAWLDGGLQQDGTVVPAEPHIALLD